MADVVGAVAAGIDRSALLQRVLRLRYPLLAGCVALFTLLSAAGSWTAGGDWSLLSTGARTLTGPAGWHTYVAVPGLQAGPLSLLVVRLLDLLPGAAQAPAVRVLLAAELPWLVWLAESAVVGLRPARGRLDPRALAAGCGLLVAPIWGEFAGSYLHVDDALAVLGAGLALRLVARDRGLAAGLCVGAAAAAKPWAVGAVALLLGLRSHRRQALAAAIAVPALCWLPLALADPANLTAAGTHAFTVSPDAPLHVVGLLGAQSPAWLRTVQLAVILAAGLGVAHRRDWRLAFGAALVARLLFDCSTLSYYSASTLAALGTGELAAREAPWRTGAAWLALVVGPGLLPLPAAGVLRLAVLSAVLASLGRRRRRAGELPYPARPVPAAATRSN